MHIQRTRSLHEGDLSLKQQYRKTKGLLKLLEQTATQAQRRKLARKIVLRLRGSGRGADVKQQHQEARDQT